MGVGTTAMNSLLFLALCAVAFPMVVGKTPCVGNGCLDCDQIHTCKGVCSVAAPGNPAHWALSSNQTCTGDCQCWQKTTCEGDCDEEGATCFLGLPPQKSTFKGCSEKNCSTTSDGDNCFCWERKPCDATYCKNDKCFKRFVACKGLGGICSMEEPKDGGPYIFKSYCHKYADCKCWIPDPNAPANE